MTCLSLKAKNNSAKSYTVEIVPNNDEKDNQEGLRILARIIARKFLLEQNRMFTGKILEEDSHEQHIRNS